MLSSLELCAGAGGQALGLEQAQFEHEALVENDPHCCNTLRENREHWNVCEEDVQVFKNQASRFRGVDLVAGGLPCPPFSVAGKQLGAADERNLFPDALEIINEVRPKAVMIENVRGFLDAVFSDYREDLKNKLETIGKHGYTTEWKLLNSSSFGVPQLRPRVVIVSIRKDLADRFEWPRERNEPPPTVASELRELMGANGWKGLNAWAKQADAIAPTIVGGSKKHGGPDLGPTRAKKAWAALGVNGKTIAEEAPEREFVGEPRLTVPMVARLQGFPPSWVFVGRKTHAYRQVGNAFPPPVARAVAEQIANAITVRRSFSVAG